MAFSIPWLETVSKRERQRREEKAQKLMFPFGDEQRTAELAVLRALIQTKARDADLLYQLFQAKCGSSSPGRYRSMISCRTVSTRALRF